MHLKWQLFIKLKLKGISAKRKKISAEDSELKFELKKWKCNINAFAYLAQQISCSNLLNRIFCGMFLQPFGSSFSISFMIPFLP